MQQAMARPFLAKRIDKESICSLFYFFERGLYTGYDMHLALLGFLIDIILKNWSIK